VSSIRRGLEARLWFDSAEGESGWSDVTDRPAATATPVFTLQLPANHRRETSASSTFLLHISHEKKKRQLKKRKGLGS